MSGPTDPAPPPDAGARNYTFLALTALLVLLLALLARGFGTWSLLPIVIGLVGLRLRGWALVMLVTLGGLLFISFAARAPFRQGLPPPALSGSDLLLAAATLAYMAAHFRLLGFTQFLFPRDPRRTEATGRRPAEAVARGRPPTLAVPPRRSPGTATAAELFLLLASLPLFCGLALVCLQLTPGEETPDIFRHDMRSLAFYPHEVFLMGGGQALIDALWRGRWLLWGLGGGVLLVSALLSYLAWGRMTAAEAALVLQDTVWAETRGEQRRIDSWLVGARLRRGRREDPS